MKKLGTLIASLALPLLVAGADLKFHPDGDGFAFDTGVLKGKLRAAGKSKGLSSLVHVPTGTALDRSMGLVGHYRVFSAGKRYGNAAWDWPSDALLTPEGQVEVRWHAAEDRPFELRANYAWVQPDCLEVETSVLAKSDLAGFESFLAAYFTTAFTNAMIWAKPAGDDKRFLTAEKENGLWQVFPRDEAAMRIVKDGRWDIPPSPVDWVRRPDYAAPVVVRRAPQNGLTAVLMARPEDCFAVLTPEQTEGHYSAYLSLLGKDLRAGETARARARLWITPEFSEAAVAKEYERFTR